MTSDRTVLRVPAASPRPAGRPSLEDSRTADLVALAPAIISIPALPWLDGLHRARIRSNSPHTFAVFAIAFLPMILFTVAYAAGGAIAVDVLVVIQLLLQATFTTAVHLREAWLGGLGAAHDRARPWPWAALLPVLCILLGTPPHRRRTDLPQVPRVLRADLPRLRVVLSPLGTLRTSLLLLFLVGVLRPCAIAYEQAFIVHQTRPVPRGRRNPGLAILISLRAAGYAFLSP